MNVNLVGISRVDYTSRKTGQPVLGWNLFCEFSDPHVQGLKTESFFVSDRLGISIPNRVPCKIKLTFGRYDRLEDISVEA